MRDQSVVLALPGGDRHLLEVGQTLPGAYDLKLLSVLPQRVELLATRADISDRRLKLWFAPGQDGVQLVSSNLEPPPLGKRPASNTSDETADLVDYRP